MLPLHPHDPPSVGPHRLHARLGEETFTRVYLGSDSGGAPVAIKVARSAHATDPAFRAAFAQRVLTAREVFGPHVCEVRDADPHGATPWVAVDRPFGPSLTELVRGHGPLGADALVPLALALASALTDLHASGRAHGSLWPDGVLLTPRTAVLADPGLEWLERDGAERAPHPAFAAPEGGAGPAADVLSWAATLCFAASGVEGPDGLARVPLQLRGLVDACLRRHPSLRPSAADLVRMLGGPGDPGLWPRRTRTAIEAVAARQRAVVSPVPGGRSAAGAADSPARGGRRVALLGAGGLVLALVAGSAVAWTLGWPPGGAASDGEPGASGAGLVTDAACLDGTGYPAPGVEPDGAGAGPIGLAFGPDGDALAVTTEEYGLTVWDWRAGEEIARPADEVSPDSDPVFAPTGCTVAAVVPVGYEGIDRPVGVAHTFDLPSGTTAGHLGPQVGPEESGGVWPDRPRDARDVGFAPDGGVFAVALDEDWEGDTVGLVDPATGEPAGSLVSGPVTALEFVAPGRVAVSRPGTISVWDLGSEEAPHTVRGTDSTVFAVVPGRDEVVYRRGERLVWFDYAGRSELGSFALPGFAGTGSASLVEVTVEPERSRVYASWEVPGYASDDGETVSTSHVWDLETGADLADRDGAVGFRRVAVHSEGEVLAAITAEGRVVIVDPRTLEPGDPLF
ncbi:acyl-ACP thioesterase [Nocardiopsis sp. FIRDI 009]|uniref:acyl-ACP thioesterase n=1 Tax=Nocardiopsis sp. FIRDI 009 TaxID=714197 RepID=UPI000E22AAFF|nr:acyl-ACP thioesterase [Nocardiopsis sp. FIRDI 009]